MNKYSVVDLFAGAGGLSLGFIQTNRFDVKVAFENNPVMQETYKKNHPGVEVQGDVCSADYSNIQEKYGHIDVVIGGPPCQGFSNANRQRNHAVSQNNMLVKQYIRAITELQPKAFVMENVSMLKSDIHRFYMDKQDIEVVSRYNIPVKETALPLIDKDFYFEDAQEIISDKQRAESYLWPEEQYATYNVIYKASKNLSKLPEALTKHKSVLMKYALSEAKSTGDDHISLCSQKAYKAIQSYFNGTMSLENIAENLAAAIMNQRMLNKAIEIIDNNIVVDRFDTENGLCAIIRSFAVFDYLHAILSSDNNGYSIKSDVVCAADYGAPQKRMRFVVVGVKKEISSNVALPKGIFTEDKYRTVRDAIEDLETIEPVFDLDDDKGMKLLSYKPQNKLALLLRDSNVLFNHIVTRTTDTAMERFKVIKQGQNFHSLDDSMKTNTYTDSSRTQNTIYLRLAYDEPSGTVVNVRKSMWIHPTKNRAISVREAARLQTFPDSFVFCGSKDKQYQQVGNAVPPILAKSIAKNLAELLTDGVDNNELSNNS